MKKIKGKFFAFDLIGCKKPEDAFCIERIRKGKNKGGVHFYIAISKKDIFLKNRAIESIILKLTFNREGDFIKSSFFTSKIIVEEFKVFNGDDEVSKHELSLHRGMAFLIHYANEIHKKKGIKFIDTIRGFISATMFVFTKHAEIDLDVVLKGCARRYSPKDSTFRKQLFLEIKKSAGLISGLIDRFFLVSYVLFVHSG